MPRSSKALTDDVARIYIPSKNEWTAVDAKHEKEVGKYTWNIHSSGYPVTFLPKKDGRRPCVYLHRLILELEGIIFADERVGHADGDKLNNVSSNLMIKSVSEVAIHRDLRRNNSSGFTGVYNYTRSTINPWRCHMGIGKKSLYLGCFSTAEEAAMAYNKALRARKDIREECKIYNRL